MISVAILSKKETRIVKKNVSLLMEDQRVKEVFVDYAVPVSKARQQVLNKCKQRLVFFLDGDVLLGENPLNELLPLLKGRVAGVSAQTLVEPNCLKNQLLRINQEANLELMPEVFESSVCMFECGLFKRKPLVEANPFDVNLTSGEDNRAILKLKKNGFKVLKTKRVIAKHFYDPKNLRKKQVNYGKGVGLLQKEFSKNYTIFNEFRQPSFLQKWVLRARAAKRLRCLHLIPLLPFYNLYVGYWFQWGVKHASVDQH